jgi:serine/threonine-protein kinase
VTLQGRYRIVGPGVASGMVVRYAAETVADGLPVVIAVLRGDVAADAEFVAAVQDQAQRIAKSACVHPALVRIHDTGTTDRGEPFVALEPVAGQSLREVLDERGVLPVRDGLRLAIQIGEGLETLHRNGIVHGELRPEAVVLLDDEYGDAAVKLVGVELTAARRTPAGLRIRNEVIGPYLAPEQIVHAETTEASDVHGLGLLIRELLTGQRPDGGGRRAVELPPAIRRILTKALAPGPGRRYSSISLMVNDLWTADSEPAKSLARVGAAMPAIAVRRSSAARHARSDIGMATALVVGLLLVGVTVWVARSDRLMRGAPSAPEPAVAASPVTPAQASMPAPPPSGTAPPPRAAEPTSTASPAPMLAVAPAPVPSRSVTATAESAPPLSTEHATAAAFRPATVGSMSDPRPTARQPERPARADQPSADAADGTAIIDWLLKGGRSGG